MKSVFIFLVGDFFRAVSEGGGVSSLDGLGLVRVFRMGGGRLKMSVCHEALEGFGGRCRGSLCVLQGFSPGITVHWWVEKVALEFCWSIACLLRGLALILGSWGGLV